jgi:hypothetical protein
MLHNEISYTHLYFPIVASPTTILMHVYNIRVCQCAGHVQIFVQVNIRSNEDDQYLHPFFFSNCSIRCKYCFVSGYYPVTDRLRGLSFILLSIVLLVLKLRTIQCTDVDQWMTKRKQNTVLCNEIAFSLLSEWQATVATVEHDTRANDDGSTSMRWNCSKDEQEAMIVAACWWTCACWHVVALTFAVVVELLLGYYDYERC